MFSNRYETDTIQHMLGVAIGWRGLPRPSGTRLPECLWFLCVPSTTRMRADENVCVRRTLTMVHFLQKIFYLGKPNFDGSVIITFLNSIDHSNILNIGFGCNYLTLTLNQDAIFFMENGKHLDRNRRIQMFANSK